jgi:protein XRP2
VNAKLNVNNNKWSEVFDFTPNLEKRNWNIMNPGDFPGQVVKAIEGFETPP